MSNFHPRRPSGAMLVACLALFIALGGAAYAANAINGKKIQNGTITGSKLKDGAVAGSKLANGAVTGSKVAANSLSGTQINEAELGPVPHATLADTVTNAKNSTQLAGIAAASYVHGIHLVSNVSAANSETKTVTAVCPSGEVAIGGGGNNTANTGTVTFDRLQLEARSYTITEFEVVPNAQAWKAEAEVLCGTP